MLRRTIASALLLLGPHVNATAQVSFSSLASQPSDSITSIAVDSPSSTIYASTSGGVFVSGDHGLTWSRLADLGALGVRTLYIASDSTLYAGVDTTALPPHVGLLSYNTATNTWTPVNGAPLHVTAVTQDGNGNLIVGTGTDGNFSPNPISYGNGLYVRSGSSWSSINSGVPNLPGYSVLPTIRALMTTPGGQILAATYGAGVLAYNGSAWSTYGSGLPDAHVNSLVFDFASAHVLAGLDSGVASYAAGTWTTASGLPNKPVRALARDAHLNLYAGLGFYPWMDGPLTGDVYVSKNQGASWESASSGLTTSDVLALGSDASGNGTMIAGAAGLWRSTNAATSWTLASAAGTANIIALCKDPADNIYSIVDNASSNLNYGGVFRSSDDGASWVQVINGIQRHRGTFIFCDAEGGVWAGFGTFDSLASNSSYTSNALYFSSDQGATWVQNTNVLTPNAHFTQMAESPSGKLYLSSGFGSPSNVSESSDHVTWNNTLNGGAGNGGLAFTVGVNAMNDVFIGTETQGVMRSLSDGTAPFTNVSPIGGNSNAFVDRHSGAVFATIAQASGNWISASAPADNGTHMFAFQNLPTYSSIAALTFDNRGNAYLVATSGNFTTSGLYTGSAPWNANSVFTRVNRTPSISWYFTSLYSDHCGYIYGTQGGIFRSDAPVDTPQAASLLTPADGAAAVSTQPSFSWTHPCDPDSFRLQIATDAAFTNVVTDVSAIVGTSYSSSLTLAPGAYWWRVSASNAAGTSTWTQAFTFSTLPDRVFADGFDP